MPGADQSSQRNPEKHRKERPEPERKIGGVREKEHGSETAEGHQEADAPENARAHRAEDVRSNLKRVPAVDGKRCHGESAEKKNGEKKCKTLQKEEPDQPHVLNPRGGEDPGESATERRFLRERRSKHPGLAFARVREAPREHSFPESLGKRAFKILSRPEGRPRKEQLPFDRFSIENAAERFRRHVSRAEGDFKEKDCGEKRNNGPDHRRSPVFLKSLLP